MVLIIQQIVPALMEPMTWQVMYGNGQIVGGVKTHLLEFCVVGRGITVTAVVSRGTAPTLVRLTVAVSLDSE